eukprot:sb/3477146/
MGILTESLQSLGVKPSPINVILYYCFLVTYKQFSFYSQLEALNRELGVSCGKHRARHRVGNVFIGNAVPPTLRAHVPYYCNALFRVTSLPRVFVYPKINIDLCFTYGVSK